MSTGLENDLLEGDTTESDFSSNVLTWDGSEEEARELFDGLYVAEMFNNDFDLFLEYLNDYAAMRDEVLGENAYLMENDDVAQEVAEAGGLLQWAGAQAAAGNDVSPEYLAQLQQNWFGAMEELNSKYGLDVAERVDSDGNRYSWTGTGWNRYYEAPSKGWSVFSNVLAAVGTGVITGGLASGLGGIVSSALPGLSTTVTSAISNTIASVITQGIANGGDIDFSSALMSGLQEFISFEGVGDLLGDLGIEGETPAWLQDIVDGAEDFLGKVEGAISTGIDPIDAMIQAGGMNMLTQLVTTGDIDPQQAIITAGMAAGQAGIQELVSSGAVSGAEVDEFEQFLAEDDELQQAFIDADIKDPFLNPNYTYVADGLMVGKDGTVYNEAGDSVGTMDELDLDGDGALNGNDLTEIEAEGEYIDPEIPTVPGGAEEVLTARDGQQYYVGEDGTVYSSDDVYLTRDGEYVHKLTKEPLEHTVYRAEQDRYYAVDRIGEDGEIIQGDLVLVGENATIVRPGTGNEFEYGESVSGNQIFDNVTGEPVDLGTAQYSGTVRGAPGDPGAEFDVYYDPTTNKTYLLNKDEPTKVTQITEEELEQLEPVTPEDSQESDPVENTDDGLDAGEIGGGLSGSPSDEEYVEKVPIDNPTQGGGPDSPIVVVPGGEVGGSTDTGLEVDTDFDPSSDSSVDAGEESEEDTSEEVEDSTGESGSDSTGTTGDPNSAHENANPLQDQVLGMLSGLRGQVASGQNAPDDSATNGTEEGDDNGSNSTVNDNGNANDNNNGEGLVDDGTGPGATDGVGDPGIGDGPGGTGGLGGTGGGGMLGGSHDPEWGELFAYTKLTPYQKQALEPLKQQISTAKGMLS